MTAVMSRLGQNLGESKAVKERLATYISDRHIFVALWLCNLKLPTLHAPTGNEPIGSFTFFS